MAVSESAGILDVLLIGACEDNFRRARLFSSVAILKSGCWNYRKKQHFKTQYGLQKHECYILFII